MSLAHSPGSASAKLESRSSRFSEMRFKTADLGSLNHAPFDPEPPEGGLVFVSEPSDGAFVFESDPPIGWLGFVPEPPASPSTAGAAGGLALVFEPEPPPGFPPPPESDESQPDAAITSNAPADRPRMLRIFFMYFQSCIEPLSHTFSGSDSGRSLDRNVGRANLFQQSPPRIFRSRWNTPASSRLSSWKSAADAPRLGRNVARNNYADQHSNSLQRCRAMECQHSSAPTTEVGGNAEACIIIHHFNSAKGRIRNQLSQAATELTE